MPGPRHPNYPLLLRPSLSLPPGVRPRSRPRPGGLGPHFSVALIFGSRRIFPFVLIGAILGWSQVLLVPENVEVAFGLFFLFLHLG